MMAISSSSCCLREDKHQHKRNIDSIDQYEFINIPLLIFQVNTVEYSLGMFR